MSEAKILARGTLTNGKTTRALFSSESSRSEEDTDISMKSDGSGPPMVADYPKDDAQIAPALLDKEDLDIHRCTHCSHVCEHFTAINGKSKPPSIGATCPGEAKTPARKSDWVKLNIGGTIFQTTRTTLCADRGSFLYRLCQDDDFITSEKDENGAYLIDRDPGYFAPILNYLRHGKLIINKDLNEDGVLEEAEFYGVTSLIKLLKQRFCDKLACNGNPENSVYRLLHCSETELPLAISTLSDGWKFQQLIPNFPNWSNDFLMVVSRDYPKK